ncbi:hypothetical protein WJX79_006468 [Trebouxia sp. C0005]
MRSSSRGAIGSVDVLYSRLVVHTAEVVDPSKQRSPQVLQRHFPVLRQIWLTAFPMDGTPLVDASPSMLRSVQYCDDLVVAGNLAAMTYAEAHLPSFSSGNWKLALDCDLQCCHTLEQLDQVSQVKDEIHRLVRASGTAAEPARFKQIVRPMIDYMYSSMPKLQQVLNMQRSGSAERMLACRMTDSTGCTRVHIQGQWDLQ